MPIEILFVDDDIEIKRLLEVILKGKIDSNEYSVTYAMNAEDALETLLKDEQIFDMVFCDINLPKMAGLSLIKEINKIDRIMKIIVMSVDGNIKNIRAAMNNEAFDFIVKPLTLNNLEMTISITYEHILSLRQAKNKLKESYQKLQKVMDQTIHLVSNIGEMRDPYTAGHQQRVSELAKAIATEMELSPEQIESIRISGLLHDIGKICIPTEILSKPGQISDNEFTLIRDHAQAGYDILKHIDFSSPIADIVFMHHEKIDGSGYPQGLKGDQILLEAKIIAVADTFEAVASYRPYRPALGNDKALSVLEGQKGSSFDTKVVETCVKLLNDGFEFQ